MGDCLELLQHCGPELIAHEHSLVSSTALQLELRVAILLEQVRHLLVVLLVFRRAARCCELANRIQRSLLYAVDNDTLETARGAHEVGSIRARCESRSGRDTPRLRAPSLVLLNGHGILLVCRDGSVGCDYGILGGHIQ